MNMVWKYSVYSIFRKQKNRLQEKANRERNKEYFQKLEKHNALLVLQTKTPLKEIKKFKQLFKCKCNSEKKEWDGKFNIYFQ